MSARKLLPAAVALAALPLVARAGPVAYRAVSLDFDVPHYVSSTTVATGVWDGAAVGYAADTGPRHFAPNAILWPGPSPDHAVLPGSPQQPLALARGVWRDRIVGNLGGAYDGSNDRAALWTGPQHTLVELHPADFTTSAAYAAWGDQQVGVGYIEAESRQVALLWSGSADSVVELGPYIANAIYEDRQGGVADGHATLWRGTAQSRVDLHPAGYIESEILGMWNDVQVGAAWTPWDPSSRVHALRWESSAEEFTDLHDADWLDSRATAVNGQTIVGFATIQQADYQVNHAVVWPAGVADDVIDLHAFVPAGASYSQAYAVDALGNIVGSVDGRAVMWIPALIPLPASVYPGAALLGIGLVMAHRARHRRG